MAIATVLGPIEPDELGVTSMHEHILCDGRDCVMEPPRFEPMPDDPVVKMENLGFIRWNLLSIADNMVIDDADNAVDELNRFRALGGCEVMDMTSIGFGRRAEDPHTKTRRTYRLNHHPAEWENRDFAEIAGGRTWIRTTDLFLIREAL